MKRPKRFVIHRWHLKLRERIYWLIYEAAPSTAEFLTGVMLALWGVWLILVPGVFASTSAYDIFEAAPQAVWGFFAFWVGFWQAAAALIGTLVLRRILCGCAALFWILVVVSFFGASPATTAIPTYGMISVFNVWLYIRLGRAIRLGEGDGL